MENKPALLSKDTFCTALRMVKEQEAINEEVATALCKVFDGLGTFGCDNKWFDALMMVLKETVNDQYDYIEWWLYEATEDYKVWEDKDHDGIQDSTEPGICNVKVLLQNAAGTTTRVA